MKEPDRSQFEIVTETISYTIEYVKGIVCPVCGSKLHPPEEDPTSRSEEFFLCSNQECDISVDADGKEVYIDGLEWFGAVNHENYFLYTDEYWCLTKGHVHRTRSSAKACNADTASKNKSG